MAKLMAMTTQTDPIEIVFHLRRTRNIHAKYLCLLNVVMPMRRIVRTERCWTVQKEKTDQIDEKKRKEEENYVKVNQKQ